MLDYPAIDKALANVVFRGRCEILYIKNKTVILDGAHNPQKMEALTNFITQVTKGLKTCFVVGFKARRDEVDHSIDMLRSIMSVASSITLTSFAGAQDFNFESQSVEELSHFCHQNNFQSLSIELDSLVALDNALKSIVDIVVVTGSLYLLSLIYNHLQAILIRDS